MKPEILLRGFFLLFGGLLVLFTLSEYLRTRDLSPLVWGVVAGALLFLVSRIYLKTPQARSPPPLLLCPICEASNPEGAHSCHRCGSPLEGKR